jgi:cyclase
VGTLEHLLAGLTEGGADAVLAASIFHYAEHTVAEAREYLRKHGVPVRPAAAFGGGAEARGRKDMEAR